jgi:hypothetical protein
VPLARFFDDIFTEITQFLGILLHFFLWQYRNGTNVFLVATATHDYIRVVKYERATVLFALYVYRYDAGSSLAGVSTFLHLQAAVTC